MLQTDFKVRCFYNLIKNSNSEKYSFSRHLDPTRSASCGALWSARRRLSPSFSRSTRRWRIPPRSKIGCPGDLHGNLRIFVGKFWWWELSNFGDLGILVIDFKILKKVCHACYPIFGVHQIFQNFMKIRYFGGIAKVMINHRGGILIFCQILSKMKILEF